MQGAYYAYQYQYISGEYSPYHDAEQSKTGQKPGRLASGLKINRGADGPAQLQVSERLRSQVAGLGQAIDN